MTTNPFEFICADCSSPWPNGRDACWNCGSVKFAENPAYGVPVERRPAIPAVPPRTVERSNINYAPYVVSAVAVGLAFGLSALAVTDILNALSIGVVSAAFVWTIGQVTITRKRTEFIEQMLADVLTRLPR